MIIKYRKKNITFKIALFIIMSIMLIMVNKTVSLAASAKITLSTKEAAFEKGSTFTVTIKVNSQESIGDFEGYLTYDADILEFVSEASFIAGGEGLIKISDINVVSGETSKKYIVKFRGKETGSSLISFRETPSVYDFETGLSMSVSINQLNVEINAKALASDNGNLKELKVEPGKLAPDFSPEITDYSISIESDIDQLIISSIPSDEKASVSIEGNKALAAGENSIEITVTAESGAKKVYKITVLKKEKENEENTKDTDEDLNNNEEGSGEYTNNKNTVILSSPEVIKESGDIYFQNGYRFQLLSPGADITIPKGYNRTSIIIDNTPIEVYSLEGDPDNEFLLIYAKGPSGREGFYQYDRLENTLMRYTNPQVLLPNDTKDNSNNTESMESKLVIMGVILVVLAATCIILTLSLIQSNARGKRRNKKSLDNK